MKASQKHSKLEGGGFLHCRATTNLEEASGQASLEDTSERDVNDTLSFQCASQISGDDGPEGVRFCFAEDMGTVGGLNRCGSHSGSKELPTADANSIVGDRPGILLKGVSSKRDRIPLDRLKVTTIQSFRRTLQLTRAYSRPLAAQAMADPVDVPYLDENRLEDFALHEDLHNTVIILPRLVTQVSYDLLLNACASNI